jgi:transposase
MSWRRGQTYSQDLRGRVLGASGSAREVAARFGVSISYVIKIRQRLQRDGSCQARPQRPPVAKLLVPLHGAIAARVAAHPASTIADLREWIKLEHGTVASLGTVWRTLRQLGLTLKKGPSGPPSRRAPTLPRPALPGANCSLG